MFYRLMNEVVVTLGDWLYVKAILCFSIDTQGIDIVHTRFSVTNVGNQNVTRNQTHKFLPPWMCVNMCARVLAYQPESKKFV